MHYVSESWAIDNPEQLSEWKKRDPFEVWSVYFDWLRRAAESGLFQVIGHADLPKKFGNVPQQDCGPLFARFLDAAAAKGVAIELNTAGLRKDCREIYPSRKLLALAHERRMPITFGSDAHAPEEVGMAFDQALALARSVGYTHSLRFQRGKQSEVPF